MFLRAGGADGKNKPYPPIPWRVTGNSCLHHTRGLGGLHHHQGDQAEAEGGKIAGGRQHRQAEGDAQGGEDHRQHQQERGPAGQIQGAVAKGSHLEEGAVGAHVVGLDQLGHRQGDKGHGPPWGQAPPLQPQPEGHQGKGGEHSPLEGHPQPQAAGENPFLPGLWRPVHQARLHRLHPQGDGGHTVGDQVNPQKLHGEQGALPPQQHGEEDGQHLPNVGAQEKAHHLADVLVNAPALPHRLHNGGEVVVG